MQRNSKYYELAVGVFLLGFSIFMYYTAVTTGKPTNDGSMASMDFPKGLLIGLGLMCAAILVNAVRWFMKNPKTEATNKSDLLPRKSLISFLFICLYALLWKPIGFTPATLLFFLAEAIMLDRKRPLWLTIVVAATATLIMTVIFGIFFKVSFPDPLIDLIRGF